MIQIRVLRGGDLAAVLDDVARLRISVFRDWPYLYDGDLAYERRYLASYGNSDHAVIVGAFDGDTLIGAATGTPMEDHAKEFADAFAETGLALSDIFYCAESVLLPEYRGRGLGHAFFDARETHARNLGCRHIAFCSVQRPDDHPLRPEAYRALGPFWRGRGYATLDGVVATFAWTDVGEVSETKKSLQFWIRAL